VLLVDSGVPPRDHPEEGSGRRDSAYEKVGRVARCFCSQAYRAPAGQAAIGRRKATEATASPKGWKPRASSRDFGPSRPSCGRFPVPRARFTSAPAVGPSRERAEEDERVEIPRLWTCKRTRPGRTTLRLNEAASHPQASRAVARRAHRTTSLQHLTEANRARGDLVQRNPPH